MAKNRQKNRLKRATGWDTVIFIALTLIAVLIFLPFYNAVVISLETNRAYALNPVSMYPVEFTLRNYEHLIEKGQIGVGYKNTVFITFIGTVLSMSAMVAMAYAFSRKRFPGKKFFFLLMMFTMFFFRRDDPDLSAVQEAGTDQLCLGSDSVFRNQRI